MPEVTLTKRNAWEPERFGQKRTETDSIVIERLKTLGWIVRTDNKVEEPEAWRKVFVKQHEVRYNGEQWELINIKTNEVMVTGTYFECNGTLISFTQ